MRILSFSGLLFSFSAVALALGPASSETVLRGYTAPHAADEVQWEQKLRALPDTARLRENLRRLSARPHHVGSPYDKDNAEWLLAQLKSYGLDAKIEQFEALFPTPKTRVVELLGEKKFVAKLDEPVLAVDPTSNQKSEQLPTYNAYSRDGDVTAPLVYVNYGAPDDYKQLEAMGVSVKGAIVIARYGKTWRGIKPKLAAEHGAIGCLIYSDPRDDGYARGDSYPEGGMRPAEGVQRGSVMDMPVYPGDPQTPGIGATPGMKQLIPLEKVETITRIPVLPLSYADARPLLASLEGRTVPENWRGGLPITYKVGPSQEKVHLAVRFDWQRKPLYDVIATIPGATHPEQWILRGNHHDAWVNGADDPLSGTSPMLEEARALGALLKQGWRPSRTIVYAFWDGEEPSLLGSTEWAETHAAELRQHAVAYINSDGNGRGFFHAEGSHSLEHFVGEIAGEIVDPETKLTIGARARLARLKSASPEDHAAIKNRADARIGALGAGSDYSPFLQHLGIASLDLAFGGEDEGTQYHSIYDDFYWYTHFSDTDFVYGRALAQTAGSMMMRLADADVLPFQFGDQAETFQSYLKEVKKLDETTRVEIRQRNQDLADGVYFAANDPKKPLVAPAVEAVPPYFNFAPLEQAIDDLTAAAAAFDKAYAAHGVEAGAALDAKLMSTEAALLDPNGLPHRTWYEHMIYAPGFYTGYGVKTLPEVREAIEQKQWAEVDGGIARTAAALEREVAALKAATALLVVQ